MKQKLKVGDKVQIDAEKVTMVQALAWDGSVGTVKSVRKSGVAVQWRTETSIKPANILKVVSLAKSQKLLKKKGRKGL